MRPQPYRGRLLPPSPVSTLRTGLRIFRLDLSRDPVLLGLDHAKLTHRNEGEDFRLTEVHGNIVKDIPGLILKFTTGALHLFGSLIAPLLWVPAPVQAQSSPPRYTQWVTTYDARTADVLTVDANDHIYVAGVGFEGVPVTRNAFEGSPASILYPQGYFLRLDPSGSNVLYGTYLNGLAPKKIVVDKDGFTHILADHQEPGPDGLYPSFPPIITPNAVQSTPGLLDRTPVLLKIAPTGELVYSTYFGGEFSVAEGLAVDPISGGATVCGATGDPNLTVSANAFQKDLNEHGDMFIARVSPNGTKVEALSYLGSAGFDYCVDLKYDPAGDLFVYGDTNSRFFPTTSGAYQEKPSGKNNLLIAKLDHNLERLAWATYLGSTGTDYAKSLSLTTGGSLLLTGNTLSMDFPTSAWTAPSYLEAAPISTSEWGVSSRPFLAVLDSGGSELKSSFVLPLPGNWIGNGDRIGSHFFGTLAIYSFDRTATLNAEGGDGPLHPYNLVRFDPRSNQITYLGPLVNLERFGGAGVSLDSTGNAVVSGVALRTYPVNESFPVRPLSPVVGQYDQVAALSKLDFSGEKYPLITQVVNAASLRISKIAPNQLMLIRGSGFSDSAKVVVDGIEIPVISTASDSILSMAPDSFNGQSSLKLSVKQDGVASTECVLAISQSSPALFTVGNTGSGQAAATSDDGVRVSPPQPAFRGRSIRVLATGLGVRDASGVPVTGITASFAGVPAIVRAVTIPPDRPDGYSLVEIQIPLEATAGDYVPLTIQVGGVSSQAGVTVAIR